MGKSLISKKRTKAGQKRALMVTNALRQRSLSLAFFYIHIGHLSGMILGNRSRQTRPWTHKEFSSSFPSEKRERKTSAKREAYDRKRANVRECHRFRARAQSLSLQTSWMNTWVELSREKRDFIRSVNTFKMLCINVAWLLYYFFQGGGKTWKIWRPNGRIRKAAWSPLVTYNQRTQRLCIREVYLKLPKKNSVSQTYLREQVSTLLPLEFSWFFSLPLRTFIHLR